MSLRGLPVWLPVLLGLQSPPSGFPQEAGNCPGATVSILQVSS